MKPQMLTESSPRHRVLIVDDEPRVAQALKRMLHAQHDLTVASCAAEAIAHVAAGERFDAIITDVMMPEMTGLDLFDRLEDLAPDQATRVIFLSGGVFTPHAQNRLETSANPQLQKPVTPHELRACVAKLVARPA
jgi:CheY-like chemotaxis protein